MLSIGAGGPQLSAGVGQTWADANLVRIGMASAIVLGALLLGAGPKEPEALRRLPADVRSKATMVVSGTFLVGRGPCEVLPNGDRRWPRLEGFMTGVVYRGEIRADY